MCDKNSISSFVPFCFFGGVPIGKKLVDFQFPVCNLFRKKIVEGQVCYEADVNQHKNDMDEIQFGFIIDTNDEYDAHNLIQIKSKQKSRDTEKRFSSILLKTICMCF